MPVRPTQGAAVAIRDGEGRILLIRENYGHRRWSLPGGAVESGETVEAAAIREAREETGTAVALRELVGCYVIDIDPPFEAKVFLATIEAGVPEAPMTDEIAEIAWFALDAVPEPTSNVLPAVLADLREGIFGQRRLVPNRYA